MLLVQINTHGISSMVSFSVFLIALTQNAIQCETKLESTHAAPWNLPSFTQLQTGHDKQGAGITGNNSPSNVSELCCRWGKHSVITASCDLLAKFTKAWKRALLLEEVSVHLYTLLLNYSRNLRILEKAGIIQSSPRQSTANPFDFWRQRSLTRGGWSVCVSESLQLCSVPFHSFSTGIWTSPSLSSETREQCILSHKEDRRRRKQPKTSTDL